MDSYSIAAYGEMINDRVRMEAYAAALARVVTPGCVVLDIGTGTGIMAMLAARHGARHVYAIEPSDAIQTAREIARANGLADRITFIQDQSARVSLPEPADVVVSDLRGILPLHGGHIPAIIDARTRLLKPGGSQIPQRDTLMVAIASVPDTYREGYDEPWIDNAYGLDLRAARPLVVNTWTKQRFVPESLVGAPQAWAELDYTTIASPDIAGRATWVAPQPAVAHGLALWFDTLLWDSIGFSNAPVCTRAIYGAAFFPWPAALPLDPGDQISVDLAADLVGDDYLWRWDTEVRAAATSTASTAALAAPVSKARFMQSTLLGTLVSPASLRKQAADFQPSLNENGEIERLILSMCDGLTPLETIARTLAAQFPLRYTDWMAALGHAGAVSRQYGR
jgi:protein arginine N-methyltransferase 1